MDFERNYPIKIPSKQLNNKFSILKPLNINKLNLWFVTGITDAESMFTFKLNKNNKRTLGWRVQSKFLIGLHVRDVYVLLQLQEFFYRYRIYI